MLLAAGTHPDPHTVLGAHPHPDGTVVRVLRPHANTVTARIGGDEHRLDSLGHGVFAGVLPYPELLDYRIVTTYPGGQTVVGADGYRFLPTLGELDLHLIGEGNHQRLWEVLGAHPRRYTTLD
ncbi:GlgB N-terminal domain-containing protein, partial [Nocardia cyriacigeorgica]